MKRLLSNLGLLVVAVLVGFSWLMVMPLARIGTTGDVLWMCVTLALFACLRWSSGVFRRVLLWMSTLSILAAIITLLGPASQWPLAQWLTVLPDFLQFSLPQTDPPLFFMALLGLAVITIALPVVRRALVPSRGRSNPFDAY
ncbi:MAG: hypothetical protein ACK4FF_07350 [Limnobacter sp.]|uniref:hypothetical protein n=1 Tax=Limnobacter sp. TaxID=2003368 RepID=UPI0039199AC6